MFENVRKITEKAVKYRKINNVRSEKRFSSFEAAILLQWRKKMKKDGKFHAVNSYSRMDLSDELMEAVTERIKAENFQAAA